MESRRSFTFTEQIKIFIHYKMTMEFWMYDLVIYDMDNQSSVVNPAFRKDLLHHPDTKHYKLLKVATKPFMQKQKVSSFNEFTTEQSEEFRRTRNYPIGNINDWYDKHREQFDF